MTAALAQAELTLPVSPEALAVLSALETAPGPVTVDALAAHLGMDERVVRDALGDLDEAGVMICTGRRGVWIGTPEENEKAIRSLKSRGLSCLVRAAKKARANPRPGQEKLLELETLLLAALEANDPPEGGGTAHVVEITAAENSARALPADGPDSPGAATGAGPGSRAGGGQPGRAQLTFLDSGPGHCRDSAQGPAGDWPGG